MWVGVWVRDPATRAPPGCSWPPVVAARLLVLLPESSSSPSSYNAETWSLSSCGRGLEAGVEVEVAGLAAAGSRWNSDEWPKKPFDMYPEDCLRLLQTSTTCLVSHGHGNVAAAVQSTGNPYCEGRLYQGRVSCNRSTRNTVVIGYGLPAGDERSGASLQTQDEADQSDQLPWRAGLWHVPEGDRLNCRRIQYVKRSWSSGTRIALSVEEGFCGLAWGLMGERSEWSWGRKEGERWAPSFEASDGGGGSNRGRPLNS